MSTSLEASRPSPVSPLRRILFLPGVRLLLALLLTGLFTLLLEICLARLFPPPYRLGRILFGRAPYGEDLADLLLGEAAATLAVVLANSILARAVERRRATKERRRPWRGAIRRITAGFLAGGALMSAIVLLLAAAGWYRLPRGGGASDPPGALLGAFLAFFLVALFEEALFRGTLFRLLEEGLGTWAALGISCLVFGGVHGMNPHATFGAAFAIALEAGVLLAAAYLLTRDIWLAVGIHWAWNFFQGDVFGAAVSGGPALPSLLHGESVGPPLWTGGDFGPEAGLMALLVATAAGVLLLRIAWRRGRFRVPAWWRERSTPKSG